jgi:hypothetical protein
MALPVRRQGGRRGALDFWARRVIGCQNRPGIRVLGCVLQTATTQNSFGELTVADRLSVICAGGCQVRPASSICVIAWRRDL